MNHQKIPVRKDIFFMEQSNLQEIWEQILQNVLDQRSLTELAINQWLRPVKLLSISETSLVLGAPNAFSKEWIEKLYIPFLENAVMEIEQRKLEIKIQNLKLDLEPKEEERGLAVHEAPLSPDSKNHPEANMTLPFQDETPAGEQTKTVQITHDIPGMIAPVDASSLNPHYTFDTFVTGNSNRFAHAAALAVAESPGRVYNPFFMYGGVGLGKTHLMHAIGNKILEKFPAMRVLYISSEKFTNELINSIRDGNPESFRQKYRNIDVLLVDDIQFLSKKEHTQEEFFHTFNTLHDANKYEVSGKLDAPGDPRVVAGVNIEVTGLGRYSGKYAVDSVIHTVDGRGGHVMSLDIRRGGKGSKGRGDSANYVSWSQFDYLGRDYSR